MKSILIIWVLSNSNGWVIEQQIPVDACSVSDVTVPQNQLYAGPHHPDMRAAICYTPTPPKDPQPSYTGPAGSVYSIPPSMTEPR